MNLSIVKIALIYSVGFLALMTVGGCSDPYTECLEKEKAEYRDRNPKASYGQVQSRQQDFELMCSKFKSKK